MAVDSSTLEPIHNAGHLICLGIGCFAGGRLSAMELPTRRLWHATEDEVGSEGLIDPG